MRSTMLVVALVTAGCDGVFGLTEIPPDSRRIPAEGCVLDRFDDGSEQVFMRWLRASEAGGYEPYVDAQRLAFPSPSGVMTYTWASSRETYNLTGARMTVRAQRTTTAGAAETYVAWSLVRGTWYGIAKAGEYLFMRVRDAGVDYSSINIRYDEQLHQWWRIEHVVDGPTQAVAFLTSRSGHPSDWEERHRITDLRVPLGSLFFEIGAGAWEPTYPVAPDPLFDDFELCLR